MASMLRKEDVPTIIRAKLTETNLIALGLRKVLTWGCSKSPGTEYQDHIRDKYGDKLEEEKFKNVKKILNQNSAKLKAKECNEFDVTFLYSLIPILCDGIEFLGTKGHSDKLKDSNSLEFLLKEAKDYRNRFAHENIATLPPDIFDEVNQNLEKLLKKAAGEFGKDPQALSDAIAELNKETFSVKKESQSRESIIAFIMEEIYKGAISELNGTWKNMSETLAVPLMQDKKFTRKLVYSQLKMTVPDATSTNGVREVRMDELVDGRQSQFALIKGHPGAGKTVLSKHLMDLHLEKAEEMKKDILLYASCRTSNQETIGGLLKESLSKTLCFTEEKDVVEVAPQLSITFIIDGYDEANKGFKKLLLALFSKKCPNWTFLISSRPQACEELQNELRKQDISPIEVVTLQPLSSTDEKKEFMSKFMKAHPIEGVDESYLDTLPDKAVDMLNSPVLMCLFYALLARGKGEVTTLKDEGTFFSSVFEEMRMDMIKRIKESCGADKNPHVTADIVLDYVSKLSLEVYSSGSYLILREKYRAFEKDIVSSGAIQHSQGMDFNTVLSCVLTPDKDGSYHFWHTSVQEYLAARHIIQKLESTAKSPFKRIQLKFIFNRLYANPFFRIIMDACNSSSLDTLKRSVLMSF